MKQFSLILLICTFSVTVIGQSFLGRVTKQVNLREGPGTEFRVVKSLKTGAQVFIISNELVGEFYNVIDIESNKEGYIHKGYLVYEKEIPRNTDGIFNKSGASSSYNAEIEIYNNTAKTLTIRLNKVVFTFLPKERKTLYLAPGSYDYIASAPSVTPDYGSEILSSNSLYSWEFYIITRFK